MPGSRGGFAARFGSTLRGSLDHLAAQVATHTGTPGGGRTMSASLGPEEMVSFGVDQEDYLTGFATKKDPGNFDLASVGMGTDGDVNLDTKSAAT